MRKTRARALKREAAKVAAETMKHDMSIFPFYAGKIYKTAKRLYQSRNR